MIKIFCIIFTVLIAVSCVSPNFSDNVTIRQTKSDYSVVISKNEEDKALVLFYLTYDISKKSICKIRLGDATYFAKKDRVFWYPATLYSIDADSLVYVNNAYNKKRFLSYFPQKYVVGRRHYMKNFPNAQRILAPYFEKMKSEHKDTLHIGTIQQLKQTNPELMNELLQEDSIRFSFACKNNLHHIKLPVEIK